MKRLVALLVGVSFIFGAVELGLASGEKKEAKKGNATANATNATNATKPAPKKKKVEGC